MKVDDHVRVSMYKNIFAKVHNLNWSQEVLVIRKVKNTVPWKYVIIDLNGKDIVRTFFEKEMPKSSQKELRIQKAISRKDDDLHVKWKAMITHLIAELI